MIHKIPEASIFRRVREYQSPLSTSSFYNLNPNIPTLPPPGSPLHSKCLFIEYITRLVGICLYFAQQRSLVINRDNQSEEI
jgi:hypothetical protein